MKYTKNLTLAIPCMDGTVRRSLRERGYQLDIITLHVTKKFESIHTSDYIDRVFDSFLEGYVDIYVDDAGVLFAAVYDYSTDPPILAIYSRVKEACDPLALFAEWLSMYMADNGLTESSPLDEINAEIDSDTRAEWQDEIDNRSYDPDSVELLLDSFPDVDTAVAYFQSLGILPDSD